MSIRRFDFYGVVVELRGDHEAVGGLGFHFAAFEREAGEPAIVIELDRSAPAMDMERLIADQVLERGIVYNRGAVTWVDHHGEALSRYDFRDERGLVRSLDVELLIELGYLMVHSRVGERLEKRGWVRLHCLGIEVGDRAVLVLTPSGGGKSRLALALLEQPIGRLLGDDMVLVGPGPTVHPFHTPIGVGRPDDFPSLGETRQFVRRLHPTKLVAEPRDRDRVGVRPYPAGALVLATRVSAPPSRVLGATRREVSAALWRDMVVGLGLPQVLELVARHGASDLTRQLPRAARRARRAIGLATACRWLKLEIADPREALALLLGELR